MKVGRSTLPPQEHRSITVSITKERLEDAKAHGMNASAVCRAAIEMAVKAIETGRRQVLEFDP